MDYNMDDEDFARDWRIDTALEEESAREAIVCPDPDNCTPYGDHFRRAQEGRCIRCGNYSDICGHDMPFSERIKSISIDRASLRVK